VSRRRSWQIAEIRVFGTQNVNDDPAKRGRSPAENDWEKECIMVLNELMGKSISWKLFPLLVAGVLACSAGAWFGIPMYLERGVKIDAVANAQNTVKQFKILRSYYTKNVVKKVLASKALKYIAKVGSMRAAIDKFGRA
jgi:Zn-dependent membrane protease YugP